MADSSAQRGVGALNLHGVEIALNERHPTHEDWMEVFAAQSFAQFVETLNLVMDNFEFLMRHCERRALLRLLVALTVKLRDAAYFSRGLHTETRERMLKEAQALYDFACSLISDPAMRDRLAQAWASQTHTGETFGYKAPAVFAVVTPTRVFADDPHS